MLGNDLVDLKDPEAQPSRRTVRFDARVFSSRERQRITNSPDSVTERWCHWAAKEAAYKALRQRSPKAIFSPISFTVEILDRAVDSPIKSEIRARVTTAAAEFDCRLRAGFDFVHAICVLADSDTPICAEVRPLSDFDLLQHELENPSVAVRRMVSHRLAIGLGAEEDAFEILKEDGIPFVHFEQRRLEMPLSLSHHGRFAAFACSPPLGEEGWKWAS